MNLMRQKEISVGIAKDERKRLVQQEYKEHKKCSLRCNSLIYLIKRIAKGVRYNVPLDAAISPIMQNTKLQIPITASTKKPIKITVKTPPIKQPIKTVIDQFNDSLL